MSKINLSIGAGNVTTSASNRSNEVYVELTGVNESELIEALSVKSIMAFKGEDDLLDEIGIEKVKAHFGLYEQGEA